MSLIPFIVGLLAVGVGQTANAAPLTWDVPYDCPDRVALTQAIERRLGHSFADDQVELVGTISQQTVAPRYRLQLEMTTGGRSHTHTLSAERCASLVDAAAILVAVAYMAAPEFPEAEPDAREAPEPVTAVAVQQVDPIAELELPVLDEPARPAVVVAASSGSPGVLMRILGGLEFGAVPGATGTVGLAVGPLWQRARLEFQGLHIVGLQTDGDNSVKPSLFTGAVIGCGRIGRRRLEVPLCGGLELGGVRWTAEGPDVRTGSGAGFWLAATMTAAVAWHAGRRLTFMLALHGLAHVVYPDFKLGNDTLFDPKPVSGRLLLGVELRFGDPW